MSFNVNNPYGLISPLNYMLMQNYAQGMSAYNPMFMGYPSYVSPSFTGSTQTGSGTSKRVTIDEQAKVLDEKLKEAYQLREELGDKVEVHTALGAAVLPKAAYSEETGYIAEDGKNDGKISWGKKLLNLGKGVANLVTDMFCDENGKFSLKKSITSLAVGGALAAAAFLIPGAGVVLAGTALATGAFTLGKGIVKANTATTDEEAEKAWQGIGSGVTQTALAAVGVKALGKSSAVKLGVEAPKWYRADQALKLSMDAVRQDIRTAGGYGKLVEQNWGNAKLAMDKALNKRLDNVSYYESKYSKNIKTLDADVPSAGAEYRQYADEISAAYKKVYGAKNETEYMQAMNELQQASSRAQVYRNNNIMSDEAGAAFDNIIKLSKSSVPSRAYAVRASRLYGGDYIQKMNDIDSQITNLRALGNTATAEQKYQLRILTRTKAAYRSLYNANSQARQEQAIARFEQIKNEVLAEMQRVRSASGTTSDQMKIYNEIFQMVDDNILKAGIIIENRASDLTRAANVLKKENALASDKAEARRFISQYLSSNPADDEAYISAVDDIISNLKYEPKISRTQRALNWIPKKTDSVKQKAKFGWATVRTPEYLVTSTLQREFNNQSVWAQYGKINPNSTYEIQNQALNKYISDLENAYSKLNSGEIIDIPELKA